ncbi:MAG: hypothetical protein MJ182_08940 [Treponema sp.]|nr:hypothetical protein [Treponema sp.]
MTFDEYKKLKKSLEKSDKYNFICEKFNISPSLLSEILQYQAYNIFHILASGYCSDSSKRTAEELKEEVFNCYVSVKESIKTNTFAQTMEQNDIHYLI